MSSYAPSLVGWRLVAALATAFLVVACSSSGSTPTHSSSNDGSLPPPSPVGKTTGAVVTKTIGAAGGSLSSADGGITVDIPAGSLATDTQIGIQPIENTTSSAVGGAFRLTPTGQTFTQPVQVSFPYTDADLEGTAAEALGIAYQDDQGRWEWQRDTVLDSSARRLTVQTTHFSDWSKVGGVQLRPPNSTVKLNAKVSLVATICVKSQDKYVYMRFICNASGSDDDLADLLTVNASTWKVDGATGGNPTLGTVKGTTSEAVYTAPAKKPRAVGGKSTVTVSVETTYLGLKAIIFAHVTITGGYRVTGAFKELKTLLVCGGSESTDITDTVEFSLTPTADDRLTVTDIKNGTTRHGAVRVPIVGIKPTVKVEPEVFTAKSGSVDMTPNSVTASLDGQSKVGSCHYGGVILGPVGISDAHIGVTFDIDKFVGGKQSNLPDDSSYQKWVWTVTQQ